MRTISGIEQLLNRNIDTELLCFPGSRIHEEALKNDFVIHTAKAARYFHPVLAARVAQLNLEKGYEIIHTQASHDLWLLVPALTMMKSATPLILTKRVGSFVIKKDRLHTWLYDRVTKAIAISEVIKKNLIDTTPLAEEKIVLLHNGVDLERFNPKNALREKVREEFAFDESDIVIGIVGRFSWGKGHEEYLKAAKVLSNQYDNLKFLIVGEPSVGEDGYGEKIKNMATDLELDDSLIFTGYRSDVPDVLSALDIFAFPSHSEAFGQSLVEAMAMGIPSVCSNSDGVLDIAVDGVTSYLFQNKNAEDLHVKLKLLIDSPEKRTKFGSASIERVNEKFELVKQTDKLIALYEKVLKSSS